MIGWIGDLFKGSNIVEAGTRAVDSVVLTKEEKTEYFLKFIEASLPMNISRRIIASVVAAVWAVGAIAGGAAILLDHSQTKEFIEFLLYYVAAPFSVIVSWYFWKGVKERESMLQSKLDEYLAKAEQ